MGGKIQMSSYICFKKQKVLYGKWVVGPVSLTRAVCSAKIKTLWKGVRAVEGGGLENR